MGSLNERATLEFTDESLESPGSIARKKHSFDVGSLSNGGSDNRSGNLYMSSSHGVIESIKIVVLSTKLNILMIFGPIAIIVDKTSGSHVSCVCSALLLMFFL